MFETQNIHYRRVAKKNAFCVSSLCACEGAQGDHEPLPISPNRLSAGRTHRIFSARDFLPSGVSVTKGIFFGQGFEPLGSSFGQVVTRHPSYIMPRRASSTGYKERFLSAQRILSMTGFGFSPSF
jgi:hypothetical protein